MNKSLGQGQDLLFDDNLQRTPPSSLCNRLQPEDNEQPSVHNPPIYLAPSTSKLPQPIYLR